MGFFDSIFGGGESKTTPVKMSNWNPEQEAIFKQLAALTKGGATPRYPGQGYVPASAYEQAFMNFAGGNVNAAQTAQDAVLKSISGPAWNVDPNLSNAVVEQAVAPAYKRAMDQMLPTLKGQFGTNFKSSGYNTTMGNYVGDMTQRMAGDIAQLRYGDETARRQAQTDWFNRMSQTGMAEQGLATQTAGAGAEMGRNIAEQKELSDLNRWMSGEEMGGTYNPFNSASTRLGISLLGYSPYSYGTETTQSGGGFLSSLLSGASKGLGMFGGAKLAGMDWSKIFSGWGGGGGTTGGFDTSQYANDPFFGS